MEQKKFSYHEDAHCAIFEILLAEMNFMNSSDLRKNIKDCLDECTSHETVIDLSRVEFIDSTGIGTLIAINNLLKTNGKQLHIVCASKRVQKIFNLSKIDKMVAIYPTMEEAVKQFK